MALATAYVGLGSNMGDRYALLCAALTRLQHLPRTRVVAVSSIYETAPWGYHEQGPFLNGVAQVHTHYTPRDLLQQLLRIETDLGRTREIHWGPRLIDLDLLLYDDVTCATADLTLPHPRMGERLFVLVPLIELNLRIKVAGVPASAHVAALTQTAGELVKRWGPPPQYAEAAFS